ncbi:MAG: hypothetical protein QGG42_06565 [Phycisphaerae bacterium]|jgi:hypothetical protein|nr:hypothetical protein [Phycisphaerae bacterium]
MVNTHQFRLSGRGVLLASCMSLMVVGGCGPSTHVYDSYALLNSRTLTVLPGVGAPGPDGRQAGAMQAGVMITELANLQRYHVTGGGHLRKELADRGDPWDGETSTALAKKLDIDLLVLPEVTDYYFTKKTRSRSFLLGSSSWTTSEYWVTVRTMIVRPDGKLVYSGTGSAKSDMGYGPAVLQATSLCIDELRQFLARAGSSKGAAP